MFILHHFLIDDMLFLTLVSNAGLHQFVTEIPDPFCSRAMLICSIIWLGKRMLRVVVLRVCLRFLYRLPVFSVADLYCLKLFLRLLM